MTATRSRPMFPRFAHVCCALVSVSPCLRLPDSTFCTPHSALREAASCKLLAVPRLSDIAPRREP